MKYIITILALILFSTPSLAQEKEDPIKIGWLYSYTAIPHWMERARGAAELAVEEFNNAGGLNGREVELIIRDDRGEASDGLQVLSDLVDRENIDILAGQSFTVVSKAVYEYAERFKIPYFATWCDSKVCVKRDNGYTFSFEEPYDQSAFKMAKEGSTYEGIDKWAIVRNQDTWNLAITKPFKEEIKRLNSNAEIVAEIAIPWGEAQGGAIIQKLRASGAEGVYITLSGGDLSNYIRAQRQRGTLDDYKHIHAYLPPEELDFLGEEAPVGWYALGYPNRELDTPEHIAFIDAFQRRTGKEPGLTGILSYAATQFMLETIKQAGTVDRETIVAIAPHVSVQTPVGLLSMNPETHVGDFTYWYGYIDLKNGKPVMVNFENDHNNQ